MDRQEITEELEHPGARNLLDSATLLRLSYNGSDGFPRVIPIGFYWNGNAIVICTAVTAPKVKSLSSRPHVATTIDVGDTPAEAKALLVRGLASVDIVDGVPDEFIAASRKALGADEVAEFERQVRSIDAFTAACQEGDLPRLVALLDPDVVLRGDGGGKVATLQHVAREAERVARMLLGRTQAAGALDIQPAEVNGAPGLVIRDDDGELSVMAFTVDAGLITAIDLIRNPDKLTKVPDSR